MFRLFGTDGCAAHWCSLASRCALCAVTAVDVPGKSDVASRLFIQGTVSCDLGGWQAGYVFGLAVLAEGKEGGNSASMIAVRTRGVLGTYAPKGVCLSTTDESPLP